MFKQLCILILTAASAYTYPHGIFSGTKPHQIDKVLAAECRQVFWWCKFPSETCFHPCEVCWGTTQHKRTSVICYFSRYIWWLKNFISGAQFDDFNTSKHCERITTLILMNISIISDSYSFHLCASVCLSSVCVKRTLRATILANLKYIITAFFLQSLEFS
jgi:hypothetical protein